MMKLSGFADEISPDLDEQLRVLEQEGIRYLELRGVWGKNVVNLDASEVKRIRKTLSAGGFQVSAIGSPIGKIGVEDPFPPHLDDFRRILDIATELETGYIRIFSFYIPQDKAPEACRDEVLERLSAMLEAAEGSGLMLLHENEKGIYGNTAERCKDLLDSIGNGSFRAIFDPANFVQEQQKPYSHCYPLLKDYVEYCHIKDALMADGKVVPAGEGDGEIQELLEALRDKGYTGFLSLEPHLVEAGRAGGYSGPELFRKAAGALKQILDELGINYTEK
ncbi:MAG: sugar phosphate isomerase/epimerase [Firmicutes bacterium]|nr:sugar phosphate isomerase/epimerase [Bacillota bacterium]